MTRWKSLNRPKFSGFRPGRTLAPATGFVRPLSGEMLYACSRPGAVIAGVLLIYHDRLIAVRRYSKVRGIVYWEHFRALGAT